MLVNYRVLVAPYEERRDRGTPRFSELVSPPYEEVRALVEAQRPVVKEALITGSGPKAACPARTARTRHQVPLTTMLTAA